MRSFRLPLALVLALSSGCSSDDGDYSLVVTWLLNGYVPDALLCQELGIAKARLEVRSGAGTRTKTLEAACESQVENLDGQVYGGFVTSEAFAWGVEYDYTLTLLDAQGNVRSTPPASGSFFLGFEEDNYYQLGFLDYVAPAGQVAALYGEWSVGVGDIASTCAQNRIAKVQIIAVSALDTQFEGGAVVAEAPCSSGMYSSNGAKVLATGHYLFRYEAYSDAGALVEAGAGIEVQVDGTRDVVLPRETFLSN